MDIQILGRGPATIVAVHGIQGTRIAWQAVAEQQRERRLGLAQAADHDAVAMTWTAISRTDQRSVLGAIDIPALVLHGSEDEDSPPPHASWLAQGLAQAQLVMFEGAGHSLLSQCAGLVAGEIRRFIAQTPCTEENA